MRIAVVGAGAMGSIFGAGLKEAGHETVLVDVAGELVDAINAEGVTVEREESERVVEIPATTDPSSVGQVDTVVFFVKCYHTAAAAEGARPLVGPGTIVASLQNGWGNGEVLADAFGAEQLVVGVTYNSGTVRGLARVGHTGVSKTLVGAYTGSSEKAQPLAEALTSGGFETEVADTILVEIWKKLILNAATVPTSALTGLSIAPLGEPGPMLDLVDDLAREATAVARAHGYEIDPEERVSVINDALPRGGSGKASMLQDFEANRKSEIDVISGAIVRHAVEAGMDVPLNRAMVALVKGNERARGIA
ncbi:MAG: ketopantoate reductase family protein [Gaiellales bacterium]